jgi:hypothetical protein
LTDNSEHQNTGLAAGQGQDQRSGGRIAHDKKEAKDVGYAGMFGGNRVRIKLI